MSEAQIETLSLAEVMALRARYIAEQKRREKELRYILAALTGNKSLLQNTKEHVGPGPKPEELGAPLDKAAMEFSKRLASLGV